MSKTFSIIKNNFGRLLILSFMIVLPVCIFQGLVLDKYMPENENMFDKKQIWYLAGLLLLSCITLLYKTCVIKISFDAISGQNNSISELMDFAMKIWPKMIATLIIWSFFVAFGFMFFIIPGIVFFVTYYLNQHVVIKEEIWGRNALMISQLYARNNIFKIIGSFFAYMGITVFCEVAFIVFERFFVHYPSVCLVASLAEMWFIQVASSIIDIYLAVNMSQTKIDFDLSKLKSKKRENDE